MNIDRIRMGSGIVAALAGCMLLPTGTARAHGNEARYVEFTEWKADRLARAFGANRAHADGIQNSNNPVQIREIEGKSCLVGDLLMFDVDDRYAFDVDESVQVAVTYAGELTSPFVVGYDRNGGTGQGLLENIAVQNGPGLRTVQLKLERARLAGQFTQGADIAISSQAGIAVCDIRVERDGTTKVPTSFGDLQLSIKDGQTGASLAARVGIYDASGRAPLASDKALMLQRFADDLRMLPVNERTFWPSPNRQAFYADGSYSARLPQGTYELVVTRGPEYRAYRGKFEVRKDKAAAVSVKLERYVDMPSKGWWSGDAHIHLTRDDAADPVIWGFVAAEDVHVGNLLEMGNIGAVYFKQPTAWGKASRFERDGHFLVSGQEDPRTGQMGHTIHHNLQRPIRPGPNEYFLYHKVFEESARQGGISGFAHMGWSVDSEGGDGKMTRGLAMLAPFGMVNFIEVLQAGRFVSDGWYRLLNLGYRINPAAGSDWPYSDFPGVVRNFVKLQGPLNLDTWFESFRAGHTYVTNGPLLELTVNGRGMGEELRVRRGTTLEIVADAQMNPDVDALDRMELVVLGDVSEKVPGKGKDRVSLRKQIKAERSMWIAVRAFGSRQEPRNMTVAHSTPIYVVVEDEPTWKADAVPTIVAEIRDRLQRMKTDPLDNPISTAGPPYWETRQMTQEQWLLQRPLLRPRIDAADAAYQKLLDQHSKFSRAPSTAGAGGAH